MNPAPLTARYRPQTFAELAGQATLKAILSRAAAEDKIAPAYMFSGTRGVGKTTIARVFAKALNCRKAPTAEPCNACDNCRAITQGSSLEVVEIDGASNRGIDDMRKLKESVGYAPMSGRYKVFIIDEAHMLSREAFNALLKTLEEPPSGVTFILATTEPHKFPPTIVSRCQHYVFKGLSERELEAHLKKILALEKTVYEEEALRLLARRAAGSARDAISLLSQTLALGAPTLTGADTRAVLGLAGQELFFELLDRVKAGDGPGLSLLVQNILDQGLDLGFFLREMIGMWRNLFILRQAGAAAAPALDLPEADLSRWLRAAEDMELAHIHAAWQMCLEGQRRVLFNLEPAQALELLLLNLAALPRLLSLEQISVLSRKAAPQAEKKSPPPDDQAPFPLKNTEPMPEDTEPEPQEACKPLSLPGDWEGFMNFCAGQAGESGLLSVLQRARVKWREKTLLLRPQDSFTLSRLETPETASLFKNLLQRFYGRELILEILPPLDQEYARLRQELEASPVIQALQNKLGAEMIDYGPL